MDMESGAFVALTLGFLLGLRHATDADHVVAVSTIVSEYRNAWRGIWIGASWALGHTTPLLIVGVAVLLLKEVFTESQLKEFDEGVGTWLEVAVGVMLMVLGAQVLWKLRRGRVHSHQHVEDVNAHIHIHAHALATETQIETQVHHGFFQPGKPFFRLKSYVVGVVHGLAGSAFVMLALLPTIDSFWVGLGYLSLFGIGTIISMGVITLVLGIPFAASAQFERMNQIVATVAGGVSLILGAALIIDNFFGTTFVPM